MLVQLLEILLFVAAAALAIANGRSDVVYPFMETLRSGIKRIKFRALDQDIDLRLEPSGDVIADDFGIMYGADYKIDRSMNVENLKRKLYRDRKMGAALHIDEDGPLTINGIINTELRIEPDTLKKESRNGIIGHRVIEVLSDENLHSDFGTIPSDVETSIFEYEARQLGKDECLKAEIFVITESNFTALFNESDPMEVYMANLMNRVQSIMDTLDAELKVSLIGIMKFTKENESSLAPYIPQYPKEIDDEKTLRSMGQFYCNSKDYDKKFSRPDIIVLMTTRPLFRINNDERREILGNAFPFVCNKCMKYAIVKDTRHGYLGADIFAHEAAHVLGIMHDGKEYGGCNAPDCPAKLGYFMGSNSKENRLKFSPCSKRCVKYRLKFPANRCIVKKCDEKNEV